MTAPTTETRRVPTPVDPDRLDRLRATLISELDAQRRQVTDHEATVSSLTGQLDADSVLERELAERATQLAHETIKDIEHALARMDRGDYGTCERCGGEVVVKDLRVTPERSGAAAGLYCALNMAL